MSKELVDIISNYITPLYGENSTEFLQEYNLEESCRYHHFGTTIKIKIGDRFFLLTAAHCNKLLDGKLPSAFYTLVKDLEISMYFMPIKTVLIPQNKEYLEDEDLTFYEIDTSDSIWKENLQKVSSYFFSLNCDYSIDFIKNLLILSKGEGFIYGFPTKDSINYNKSVLTPKGLLLPVKNIQLDSNNPFYLNYEIEEPDDFDETLLKGMSGGGLFCRTKNRCFLIGMHIQGSNRIGHSTTTPLFCKSIL